MTRRTFAGGKQDEKSGHDRFGRQRGSGFGGGRVEIGSGAGKNVGQHKSVPLKLFCCSAWGCSSVVAAAAY